MPELHYTVNLDNTQAIGALRQLQSELSRDILRGRIKGIDVSDLEKQLDRVNASLKAKGFGKRLEGEMAGFMQSIPGVGRVFNALNGGAGMATITLGGLTAAAGAAQRALQAWAAEERSIMAVNAALAATGQLTPAIAAQLRDLAGDLQTATNIDDEQWSQAFATLIRLGGVAASQMDQHAKTVQGLAGLLGVDLPQATMLYVRALNGNFDMLTRVGIQLDANASKEQKLAELQRRAAAGTSLVAAQVNTLGGAWTSLTNVIQDAWKALGEFLDKGWGVTSWLKGWADILRGWLPTRIDPDVSGLANVANVAHQAANRLQTLGLAAASLDDLGAAAADTASTKFAKLNAELDRQLDLDRALLAADKDRRVAELKQDEITALSQPGLTDKQKNVIRADFMLRRANIEGSAQEQDLTLQREAAASKLAELEAERARRRAATAKLADPLHVKQAAADEAARRLQAATPASLDALQQRRSLTDNRLQMLQYYNQAGFPDANASAWVHQQMRSTGATSAAELADRYRAELGQIDGQLAAFNKAKSVKTTADANLDQEKQILAAAQNELAKTQSRPEDLDAPIQALKDKLQVLEASLTAASESLKAEAAEANAKKSEAEAQADSPPKPTPITPTASIATPRLTDLERIGATLPGATGASRLEDHTRKTADNTAELVKIVRRWPVTSGPSAAPATVA